MFWIFGNKKIAEERDFERSRANDAIARLDAKSRECDRLVSSTEAAINETARLSVELKKLVQDRQEIEKHARSLEELLASTAKRLQKEVDSMSNCQKSLDHFGTIVDEIHSLVVGFSPLQVDSLKNNSTLKSKLKEAQSLIGRIFEKSKGLK